MGRFRLFAFGLVAASALIAGCSSNDAGVSSGPSNPPGTGTTLPVGGSMMTTTPADELVTGDMLIDQTYVSTSVTGHELAEGSTITMSFTETDVSASAGCNTLSGGYSLEGGKVVVSGDLRSTMMACPEPLMAQDTWLAGWLASDLAVVATPDGISLTGEGVTVELAAQATGPSDATGAAALIGPTWTLTSIMAGDAVSSVPTDVEAPTLVFAADGTVAVFTGCNRGTTTAEIGDDGFITFAPMATTMMACESAAQSVEASVLAMLDGRVAYGWQGDDLSLAKQGQSLVYLA